MKLLSIFLLLIVTNTAIYANSYTDYTNSILRGRVDWKTAIQYIEDGRIPEGEELQCAIRSLRQYKTKDIIPYLLKYSSISNDTHIQAATFWPLYINDEKDKALNLLDTLCQQNALEVNDIFYNPYAVGTEYKVNYIKNDTQLKNILYRYFYEDNTDTSIRLSIAYSLVNIYEKLNDSLKLCQNILINTPSESEFSIPWAQRTPQQIAWFRNRKKAHYLMINIMKKMNIPSKYKDLANNRHLINDAKNIIALSNMVTLYVLNDNWVYVNNGIQIVKVIIDIDIRKPSNFIYLKRLFYYHG